MGLPALILVLALPAIAAAQTSAPPAALRTVAPAHVVPAVTPFVLEGSLASLPTPPGWSITRPAADTGEHHELGWLNPERRSLPADFTQAPDPLVAAQGLRAKSASGPALAGPAPGFEGISFAGTNPPDTCGAAGPNHYVQIVNAAAGDFDFGSVFAIYDKSGALLAGPAALEELWPSGPCRTESRGDPIVLHDQLANRWLLSQVTDAFACLFSGTGCHLCVAVSRTPDPVAGGWYVYDFPVSAFPDYPKYAVAQDAYLVGANSVRFFPVFDQFAGVYALDRHRMLGGQPAGVQELGAPFLPNAGGIQSLLPADRDGHRPPPAHSPSYFLRYRDGEIADPAFDLTRDQLELWKLSLSWNHPEATTLTGPAFIDIAEFASVAFPIPQPDTPEVLDSFAEPLMFRVSYRNFGDHETLLGNFTVSTSPTVNHAGVRWFELRRPQGGGAWSLFQEGTFAPDAAHRWMGSVSMDRDGNLALGYSISSPELGIFPSIRVTGRRAGDPLGTLSSSELTLAAGDASSGGRWGDYSAMTVDPKDDCTFWYTNEYIRADQTGWSTRIGAFRFPDCHPSTEAGTGMP